MAGLDGYGAASIDSCSQHVNIAPEKSLLYVRKKIPQLKVGTDIASTKTVFLRGPPDLHAALVVAGGVEQQRDEKVSINWIVAKVLAKGMGFEVAE